MNIKQDDLDEIINDTSIGGKLIQFYEMLQESLSQHSDAKIDRMRRTLVFVTLEDPDLYKLDRDVYELSKLEVLYFYSLLP